MHVRALDPSGVASGCLIGSTHGDTDGDCSAHDGASARAVRKQTTRARAPVSFVSGQHRGDARCGVGWCCRCPKVTGHRRRAASFSQPCRQTRVRAFDLGSGCSCRSAGSAEAVAHPSGVRCAQRCRNSDARCGHAEPHCRNSLAFNRSPVCRGRHSFEPTGANLARDGDTPSAVDRVRPCRSTVKGAATGTAASAAGHYIFSDQPSATSVTSFLG